MSIRRRGILGLLLGAPAAAAAVARGAPAAPSPAPVAPAPVTLSQAPEIGFQSASLGSRLGGCWVSACVDMDALPRFASQTTSAEFSEVDPDSDEDPE